MLTMAFYTETFKQFSEDQFKLKLFIWAAQYSMLLKIMKFLLASCS